MYYTSTNINMEPSEVNPRTTNAIYSYLQRYTTTTTTSLNTRMSKTTSLLLTIMKTMTVVAAMAKLTLRTTLKGNIPSRGMRRMEQLIMKPNKIDRRQEIQISTDNAK
ncbi:hypothetical protein GWI33_005622 [Rhynchophorus ferrugineus]|uniref:Uncharacterized protein n=1 Tax=Rhynchophorus ferrugineus TaxID=354439 RepID=A0A834IH42_RHYFE|nr:hypothetical protein GWI33_005622 [Rhynchophorus ferrugineus]